MTQPCSWSLLGRVSACITYSLLSWTRTLKSVYSKRDCTVLQDNSHVCALSAVKNARYTMTLWDFVVVCLFISLFLCFVVWQCNHLFFQCLLLITWCDCTDFDFWKNCNLRHNHGAVRSWDLWQSHIILITEQKE